MQVSAISFHIAGGHIALPEFQRGHVWNQDQVPGLFESCYPRDPVGGLLFWATESKSAACRGDGTVAPEGVKPLRDSEPRMTALHGVLRSKSPRFSDGNAPAFTGLRFHLEEERLSSLQSVMMKDDPRWIDVTAPLGQSGHAEILMQLASDPSIGPEALRYSARLSKLLGIGETDLHLEEGTGTDKMPDEVVDTFNRAHSCGNKLSNGDPARTKICATGCATA